MKWFNAGKVLFSKIQDLSCLKAVLFFPITLLMFIGIILCFLFFGISYAFTFALELIGGKSDSSINENDDKYVKISKIIFTIIISPIIFIGYLILSIIYIPLAAFTLWTDAFSFIVSKKEKASFSISKFLLTSSYN